MTRIGFIAVANADSTYTARRVHGVAATTAALDSADRALGDGYTHLDLDDGYTGYMDVTGDGTWYYDSSTTPHSFTRIVPNEYRTAATIVADDIAAFKAAVLRETRDWEEVIARENFSPHTDSGHSWSDDLLHSLLTPNIRGLVVLLETAKATPTQTAIDAYRARLDSFNTIAEDPGVLHIYQNALKAVWRPLRGGTHAYGYDVETGGIRTVGGNQVRFDVTYPASENVATWDALGAVEAL